MQKGQILVFILICLASFIALCNVTSTYLLFDILIRPSMIIEHIGLYLLSILIFLLLYRFIFYLSTKKNVRWMICIAFNIAVFKFSLIMPIYCLVKVNDKALNVTIGVLTGVNFLLTPLAVLFVVYLITHHERKYNRDC